MLLTRGLTSDFDSVCALYARVTSAMHEKGIAQWNWGTYPNADQIHKSIDAGTLYVVREGNTVVAAVTLDSTFEPAYDAVNWLFGGKPGTFHRLCIAPEKQRQGLGRGMMGEMLAILRSQGCTALRCDTLVNNSAALTLYQKIGMRIAGHIRYASLPDLRFAALEMRLTNDCPLLPLKMHPAFRGGKLTPWGGEKLRTVYGKDIREVPTGESLEVSCIPGLESTDDAGVKLPDLIAAYGEAFAGEYAKKPFPLLLKLIDAAEPLSVQVHPNDDYAARVENGKLGKTEAWLILDAPEGSQLGRGSRAAPAPRDGASGRRVFHSGGLRPCHRRGHHALRNPAVVRHHLPLLRLGSRGQERQPPRTAPAKGVGRDRPDLLPRPDSRAQ